MYNSNYEGQAQQAAPKPRKQKINEVTLVGVIRPRSANENEPFRYYPFPGGGGAIHVNIKVSETMETQEGPKVRIVSIPVDIYTNKVITEQMITSLVPGMTVRVVGSLSNNSYESKKTGQRTTTLVVRAFVLEVIQSAQPAYGQIPAYGQQPQYQQNAPQYQNQGYAPQPQYQQAPAYQQQGYGQQPQYQQNAPAYGQQQYQQASAYGPQPQAHKYPPMPPQANLPGQQKPENVNYMGGYPEQNPVDDLPLA